ncbi:hypothetical protein P7K49_016735 [Saguinus oedipus]|uniref:Uncharacterized protein n=1 Tax=Saguinus oedipus TaxID=9490 RepID=A0ABQ9VD76_SAGOE|nr:hypothetical protein P7K49_016735 [Saguinus oedipus]
MARLREEEETAGAAALARRGPGLFGRAGARARRPPLRLLCLVACWLLGAGAEADFSILDEAQVLASQMRRLAAEELGVVTMQNPLPSALNLVDPAQPRLFRAPATSSRPGFSGQPAPPGQDDFPKSPPLPLASPGLRRTDGRREGRRRGVCSCSRDT